MATIEVSAAGTDSSEVMNTAELEADALSKP